MGLGLFFVAYRILDFMLLLCVKHFSSQENVNKMYFPNCHITHVWKKTYAYLSVHAPPQQHLPQGFLILSSSTFFPDTLSTSNHSMTVSAWYWPGSPAPVIVTQVIRWCDTEGKKAFCTRKKVFFVTSGGVMSGAAECTLVSHWVQMFQVQPSSPDLVTVLLCPLLLLWTTVSQTPALCQASGQIHQGLGHLTCPQLLVWTMKPKEDREETEKWKFQPLLNMLVVMHN